jgi:hypothetical protein
MHPAARTNGTLARAYAVNPACIQILGPYALTQCRQGPTARVELSSPTTRTLRIDSPGGVPLLITGEPWYPGWAAQAQHEALGVKRVGYLAAVTVPPGVTSVTLTYSPPGLLAGAVVSALALVVLILLDSGRGRSTLRRVSVLRRRSVVDVDEIDGSAVAARDCLEGVKVIPHRRE